MSAPQVLRVIARIVEVLPGALGRLACGGLALLFVGGCTVVMVRAEPMYGVVLGAMALIAILPGALRAIAAAVERRSQVPTASEIADAERQESQLGPVSLDFRDPEENEPLDFSEEEPPSRKPPRR